MTSERSLQPTTALDLVRGPWLLTEYQYDRQMTVERMPTGDLSLALTLVQRETGERVTARFFADFALNPWECPEFGYRVDGVTMQAAIKRAQDAWTHGR